MIFRSRVFETRVYTSSTTPAHEKNNGADGDRTRDLHNAIVALSQLSYCPEEICRLT